MAVLREGVIKLRSILNEFKGYTLHVRDKGIEKSQRLHGVI